MPIPLQNGMLLTSCRSVTHATIKDSMRIAFLHLAPLPGNVVHNQRLIETGIAIAASADAHLILTPELQSVVFVLDWDVEKERLETNRPSRIEIPS